MSNSAPLLRPRYKLVLVCTAGSMVGTRFETDFYFLLGRDPKRVNLLIPAEDRLVSGVHARIAPFERDKYLLRDEHSSNGTKVNGTRVDPDGKPVALNDGDVLELGNVKFQVSLLRQ